MQKLIPETKLESDCSVQPIFKQSKSPSEIKVCSYIWQKPTLKKGNKFVRKRRPIIDFTTVQLINQVQTESIAFHTKNTSKTSNREGYGRLAAIVGQKKVLKKQILREDKKKKNY